MQQQPINFSLANSFFIANFDQDNVQALVDNNNFLLFWLENGPLSLQTILREENIEKDKLYIFGPDALLSIQSGITMSSYCIGFSIDFLQRDTKDYMLDIFNLFFFKMDNPAISFAEDDLKKMKTISDLMLAEFQQGNNSPGILQAYLKILLLELIRLEKIEHNLPDINIQRLHDFFILAHDNYLNQKSVTFYANKLNISAKRLNQILQFYTKKSITQLLQDFLITEAKRQLMYGQFTINQISDNLGFTDRAYFSRFFKKIAGVSPSSFKI